MEIRRREDPKNILQVQWRTTKIEQMFCVYCVVSGLRMLLIGPKQSFLRKTFYGSAHNRRRISQSTQWASHWFLLQHLHLIVIRHRLLMQTIEPHDFSMNKNLNCNRNATVSKRKIPLEMEDLFFFRDDKRWFGNDISVFRNAAAAAVRLVFGLFGNWFEFPCKIYQNSITHFNAHFHLNRSTR